MTDIEKIIKYIQEHWESECFSQYVNGVWLALHEDIESNAFQATTPITKAWFLSRDKSEKKTTVSFKLFSENKTHLNSKDGLYEMGESNIARYKGSDIYYVDAIMGPLMARGMQVKINDGINVVNKKLWMS